LAYQPPASSIFSQNKLATDNQPAIFFSQNKPAPVISHQPNEHAETSFDLQILAHPALVLLPYEAPVQY
jgi:hypothetical protein